MAAVEEVSMSMLMRVLMCLMKTIYREMLIGCVLVGKAGRNMGMV